MRRISALSAFVVLAGFLHSTFVWAQAPVSTLDRIKETGTIRIGYAPEGSPFSLHDQQGQVTGYSVELCKQAASILAEQLGLDAIEFEFVRSEPSERIRLLNEGKVDIECAASTNNAERRKSVSFTYSHFITATQFVALAQNEFHLVGDLSGRSVAATAGTTTIKQVNIASRQKGLNLAVVSAPTNFASFDLMATGRVSAFATDGILLAMMVANSDDPSRYKLSDEQFDTPEPYGFMVRKQDSEFLKAMNAILAGIYTSPQIEETYDRWFMSPIPPRGFNLQLPMSEALRQALQDPSGFSRDD